MRIRSTASLCRNSATAAAFALAIPLSATAGDDLLKIKVLPDRYVTAYHSFTDVTALAAWSRPMPIRTLFLETCGPRSTRHLLAAVEQFQFAYDDGIQIRALRQGDRGCASADAQYLATDGSGRSTLP